MTQPALPENYAATLDALKKRVQSARFTAQRRVNTELVRLYWQIGAMILDRQQTAGWGSGLVDQLARDLRTAFPEMKGFSRRNVFYMRSFAAAWPGPEVVQQPVAQLPWGHITVLLGRLDGRERRDRYAAQALEHGWSRNVLEHHVATNAHERFTSALTNFDRVLDEADSDLAQQITRDPYVLDFLALDAGATERQLEERLVDRIIDTLRELGTGFSFVGRQVHFEVHGDDFFVDLLFFHVDQLRYVVVELKSGKFKPEHLGQLSFYVSLVDDRLRRQQHSGTVGLLLVADKNDPVVRYALSGHGAPVGVARYDLLPSTLRAALPSEDDLTGMLADSAVN
ncbi:PDDEXK nuclease domain-containing protein [Curtobacterium sp. PhB146]|uniref:PDDEXK nuclease domain-containing protein n=1 Tax=Curtobacterium sp. PhB146 TaxID=2485187 RepID=UPI00104AA941|nr:PDDEXK nuclease domain-containing protein [Curtobacterium sp. PhB146]TCU50110.1 putative nuclease of restriction endonuclease-like (RecB) superfamily [Curtobacterium sp. PhB146]